MIPTTFGVGQSTRRRSPGFAPARDRWMAETHDPGPEPESMYDSDMAVYLAEPWEAKTDTIRRTIAVMKAWAKEGK